jgi:hypothetical protein
MAVTNPRNKSEDSHDVIGNGRRGKALRGELRERSQLAPPAETSFARPVHPQHHGLGRSASRRGVLG